MTPATHLPFDADDAWGAVLRRDASRDGQFVYAVTSTGVFCRPSCPSRRPRRDRVRFFPSAGVAQDAGFRPCRRCRPLEGAGRGVDEVVTRARAVLDRAAGERVTLDRLAREVGMSPGHLQRRFREVTGLSPREYVEQVRLSRLRSALRGEESVSRAVYEAGFGSGSRVYERSTALLGMTPGEYRREGEGLVIRFTIVSSPLGRLLVAVTDRGVCAVSIGDSETALRRSLEEEFPKAERRRVDDGADDWLAAQVQRVAEELEHPGRVGSAIPLDLRGTAFQYRVWRALISIPAGATRSYTEVARAIGEPAAVRAVARACGANRVAILVPCHRVIRSDGSLGGYRWGLPRKAELLRRESASA
jgi:AraC family transcriptional regulator of adaptative response/methylated-DNA-[protein]-cysteine methyltransferase